MPGWRSRRIAYGFIVADRAHLAVISSGARTGSARQLRIGDIDGYHGLDLEVSVEVKDLVIGAENVEHQLSQFALNVKRYGVLGLALVREIADDARLELANQGVVAISQDEMLTIVNTWDWQRQDAAVQAMLHFLSHIEQNVLAVHRLLAFIREIDPSHDSLVYSILDEPEHKDDY